ncbi:MAG TPA: tetratricopeptide repeat protein, partial [Anaerolineales bacterium]|nr:tetratricopeptide repeat protein [Anaerolineales bacterium]
DTVRLHLALCPARACEQTSVTLLVGERVAVEETCSMAPEEPWSSAITLPASDVGGRPIRLLVRDSAGNLLLESTQDRTPYQAEPAEPKPQVPRTTAEELFALGLAYENLDDRDKAQEAYEKALDVSGSHSEAHLRLGVMLLRAAQFREADIHLAHAEQLGLTESACHRGVIALYEGRLEDAERHFTTALGSETQSVAALLGLGRVALHRRDWNGAIEHLRRAEDASAEPVTLGTLLAIAFRKAGRSWEAHSVLQQVLKQDPLNHPALNEMACGSYPESEQEGERLRRLLNDDDQYPLDLACYYTDAGLLPEAIAVLQVAWSGKENVMTAYLAAYESEKVGDAAGAGVWLRKAAAPSLDFVFPSRLEEVLALEWAIRRDSDDARAKYLLANFFYAHQRYAEAMQTWREAAEGLRTNDVIYRNLGLGAWQHERDLPRAILYFEQALQLNPANQDLYLHLDDLYQACDMPERRRALLGRIQSLSEIREDVHKHRIAMMVDLGDYDGALELIATERFLPLEMDQSFHEVYVRALRLRATHSLESGEIEAAIQDYQRMLEYPASLGVGAPTTRTQARIFYELGLAYESIGRYWDALKAWREAAGEHHPHGHELFPYIQMALDKLSRYSELGLEG